MARKIVVYKRLQMEVWHDFILGIASRLLPTIGGRSYKYIFMYVKINRNCLIIR